MPPRHRTGEPRSPVWDILEADRGWLTAAGVHALLPDYQQKSIERTLLRWSREGLVEDRTVELATSGGGQHDTRREWRIVTPSP